VGFLGVFFWFFWWVFYCQPCAQDEEGEQLLDRLLAATLPNLRPYLAYRASAPEDNSMGSNNQRRQGCGSALI
jgi:hypothetical protein